MVETEAPGGVDDNLEDVPALDLPGLVSAEPHVAKRGRTRRLPPQ